MLKQTKWMALCLSLVAMLLVSGTPARAQDGLLSKQELKTLIANAKTPEDHQRLAKHFTAKAAQLEDDAKDHEALAAQYKANPNMHEMKHPGSQQTASHCATMARSLRKAAEDARKVASDHELMAKGAAAK
jgi:uncharacterized membrane-anchored protein YhcB (DUF1043 family)